MNKKAFVFLPEGFEEAEAIVTVDVLRRGGVDVRTVSLAGCKKVVGSHAIATEADITFDEAADEAADALVLPGGPGAARYYEDTNFMEYIKISGQNENIVLAAICAAPGVLGEFGLLDGRRATCYPGYESKLTGAVVTGAPFETDGNIITGKSAGCVFEFAFAILAKLAGDEAAENVRTAMAYCRPPTDRHCAVR